MLTNAQYYQLSMMKKYNRAFSSLINDFVKDVVVGLSDDFSPTPSGGTKVLTRIAGMWTIRRELAQASKAVVQRLLTDDQDWMRLKDSLRELCMPTCKWLRWDAPRIEAVMNAAAYVLRDPVVRHLVEQVSTESADKLRPKFNAVMEASRVILANNRRAARGGIIVGEIMDATRDELIEQAGPEIVRRVEELGKQGKTMLDQALRLPPSDQANAPALGQGDTDEL